MLTFDVEASPDLECNYDKVKIHDGVDDSAPRLGTFCDSPWLRIVISSSESLFISFKTDISGTSGGFKIKYTAIRRCKYYQCVRVCL